MYVLPATQPTFGDASTRNSSAEEYSAVFFYFHKTKQKKKSLKLT